MKKSPWADDPSENEGRRMARAEAEALARMQVGMASRKWRLAEPDRDLPALTTGGKDAG